MATEDAPMQISLKKLVSLVSDKKWWMMQDVGNNLLNREFFVGTDHLEQPVLCWRLLSVVLGPFLYQIMNLSFTLEKHFIGCQERKRIYSSSWSYIYKE